MSAYQPPIEDLAIFDSSVFLTGDEPLTYNQAVKKFLKFPNAQGSENLLTTNVNGVLTANDDVVFSPSTDIKWDRADANYLINDTLPKTITTGINNIALGKGAVDTITSGQGNIGIGTNACSSITTSNNNIGIGRDAVGALTSGAQNTCIGLSALQKATSGDYNVSIGSQSLRDHLTPSKMVSIGYNSNVATTSGNNCTAVGAGTNNGGFSDSVALGYEATNTSSNQIRLGRAAETVSCPGDVSIEGDLILAPATQIQWNPTARNYIINEDLPKSITTGSDNVAMGRHSLHQVTTGNNNVGFGHQAGRHITTGSDNIAIGDLALSASGSTNVFSNIAIGSNSLLATFTSGGISAQGNVAVGFDSGKLNTTGVNNIYLGKESGATSTTVSRSTALGYQANCANFDDSTAVGSQTVCTATNQIRLGKSNQTVSCPGTLTLKMASDNNSGTFYIPFSKVAGGTEGALFVDDVTGPLSYNPSTATISCTGITLDNVNSRQTNTVLNLGGNNVDSDIAIGQNQTSGRILIGSTSRTSGAINIMNGPSLNGAVLNIITNNYTGASGATCNLLTGSPTIGPATLNIMTGTKPVASNLTIGGSANVNIFLNSRTVFANPIVTNVTTAPTITNQLGYTTSKTSGWSNITNSASNINTITIDGAVIEFGVYKIDVFINYTNGAANQNFRIGVSDTTLTLPTPLRITSTQSGQDDGVFISQTISAFTNTTFYIVAQSSNAVGATLYTTGARTSGIYLTRIA
jgi:hypothetical protein